MPIRINLLAEAQAAEELRRKDPVKRALIIGSMCVVLMIAASGVIQWQILHTNGKADDYNSRIQGISEDYKAVKNNEDKLQQLNLNIRGLDILASERFLNGTLLNALQKVHVDHVQLIRLRAEETYTLTDETKAKAGSKSSKPKIVKPATATEKFVLMLEARDSSPNPGDQVVKFKDALCKNDYFEKLLGTNTEMRLVNLSPPTLQPELGRPVVQFTLETRLPDKVRLGINSASRYASAEATSKPTSRKATQQPKL